jgi:hypothetical protein
MDAVIVLNDNQDKFSKEFLAWFPDNQHIWLAFLNETRKVINAGFNHYSARTIVHVLRHHSALAERNSGWKINNNISPYLARLFALCHPAHKNLFEYRSTPRAKFDHD